jgi:hypothetical protein
MQLASENDAKLKMSKFQSKGAIFMNILPKRISQPKSKCVYCFWTAEDRRTLSTDHLQEIGVGESNGDVISGLGHHLAAEFTLSQNARKQTGK